MAPDLVRQPTFFDLAAELRQQIINDLIESLIQDTYTTEVDRVLSNIVRKKSQLDDHLRSPLKAAVYRLEEKHRINNRLLKDVGIERPYPWLWFQKLGARGARRHPEVRKSQLKNQFKYWMHTLGPNWYEHFDYELDGLPVISSVSEIVQRADKKAKVWLRRSGGMVKIVRCYAVKLGIE